MDRVAQCAVFMLSGNWSADLAFALDACSLLGSLLRPTQSTCPGSCAAFYVLYPNLYTPAAASSSAAGSEYGSLPSQSHLACSQCSHHPQRAGKAAPKSRPLPTASSALASTPTVRTACTSSACQSMHLEVTCAMCSRSCPHGAAAMPPTHAAQVRGSRRQLLVHRVFVH